MFCRTLRYRNKVHSENRAGKVVKLLWDKASLADWLVSADSPMVQADGVGTDVGGKNLPLKFVFDDIHHLIRELLDVLPTQIDGQTGFQFVADAAGLRCLGLIVVEGGSHSLPRESNHLARRERRIGAEVRIRREIPERRNRGNGNVDRCRGGRSSTSALGWVLGEPPWSLHDVGPKLDSRYTPVEEFDELKTVAL